MVGDLQAAAMSGRSRPPSPHQLASIWYCMVLHWYCMALYGMAPHQLARACQPAASPINPTHLNLSHSLDIAITHQLNDTLETSYDKVHFPALHSLHQHHPQLPSSLSSVVKKAFSVTRGPGADSWWSTRAAVLLVPTLGYQSTFMEPAPTLPPLPVELLAPLWYTHCLA